jgi:hypothetical protein
MNLYPYIRSVIRKPVCVAALLAAPVSFGAQADRQQVQAQLLDHAELLCANCFFGASDYYYCFEADNKVLIGYQKTPVLNWRDESKNYLAGVHHGWAAWTEPGQSVRISYDDKHIWVSRPDGKQVRRDLRAHVEAIANWVSRGNGRQVRLRRSPVRDIFTSNDRCRDAGRAKAR